MLGGNIMERLFMGVQESEAGGSFATFGGNFMERLCTGVLAQA
jgi:hypothetical protein